MSPLPSKRTADVTEYSESTSKAARLQLVRPDVQARANQDGSLAATSNVPNDRLMSERTKSFVILLGLGSVIAYGHIIYQAISTNTLYPISVPFFFWGDRFMDFFNVVYDSQHDPYAVGALYLPFSYVVAGAFSHLADYSTSPFIPREQLGGIAGLMALILPAVLLVFSISGKITSRLSAKTPRYYKYLITVCLIASYPFMFAMIRGNFVLVAFVFFGLFLLWYEKYRIPALTCLAMAICMKYYLVVFLAALWKKYTEIGFVVAAGVLLNLVAIQLGGYTDFYLVLGNLGGFETIVPVVQTTAFAGSAYNWIYAVMLKCCPIDIVRAAKQIYCVLSAATVAFLVFFIIKRTSDFFLRNLCLLLVVLFIPIQSSAVYNYILLIPFIPYLIACDSPSRNLHLLLVGLILISKHYFVWIEEPYGSTFLNMCENAVITPTLACILLISLLSAPGNDHRGASLELVRGSNWWIEKPRAAVVYMTHIMREFPKPAKIRWRSRKARIPF